jgi:hypothetical protein
VGSASGCGVFKPMLGTVAGGHRWGVVSPILGTVAGGNGCGVVRPMLGTVGSSDAAGVFKPMLGTVSGGGGQLWAEAGPAMSRLEAKRTIDAPHDTAVLRIRRSRLMTDPPVDGQRLSDRAPAGASAPGFVLRSGW